MFAGGVPLFAHLKGLGGARGWKGCWVSRGRAGKGAGLVEGHGVWEEQGTGKGRWLGGAWHVGQGRRAVGVG